MKTVVFSLICGLLFSCTTEHVKRVPLFNNLSFKLINSEKVVPIGSIKSQIFNSYFKKKALQIPLFRCVETDNYTVYIGLPFNTSLQELAKLKIAQNLNQTSFESDSTNYLFKTFNSVNEYCAVYIKNYDNNLVYVLAASNSAQILDSLLTLDSFSSRFIK